VVTATLQRGQVQNSVAGPGIDPALEDVAAVLDSFIADPKAHELSELWRGLVDFGFDVRGALCSGIPPRGFVLLPCRDVG
jgi:hypothetical protein